jgi:hypothetical protein
MATFKFFGDGYSSGSYDPPGYAPFRKHIDIPDLIENGGLANTSDKATPLASTGFAASDILQVFQVSVGFCLRHVGARVTTAEGAACVADVGCLSATQTHLLAADADGLLGTATDGIDLNSATTQINLIADVQLGYTTYTGLVFVTNGSIDITFVTGGANTAIFDMWAHGFLAF